MYRKIRGISQVLTVPDFGQRVAANRGERELSQIWLARRAGLDSSYLSRIENGIVQPTVPMTQKLAAALGTPLGELLGPAPPKSKQQRCPVSQGRD
jgi:transcriptional regulator with XRE-family HTH domain